MKTDQAVRSVALIFKAYNAHYCQYRHFTGSERCNNVFLCIASFVFSQMRNIHWQQEQCRGQLSLKHNEFLHDMKENVTYSGEVHSAASWEKFKNIQIVHDGNIKGLKRRFIMHVKLPTAYVIVLRKNLKEETYPGVLSTTI